MSRVILSNAKDLALGLCRRLYEIFDFSPFGRRPKGSLRSR